LLPSRGKLQSKQFTNTQLIRLMLLCTAAALALGFLAIASGQQGRREIVSDDFTRPRPTPSPKPTRTFGGIGSILGGISTRPRPSPPKRYRFAASSSPNAPPLAASDNIEQLGVTLWRLRPARKGTEKIETGQPILVVENNLLSVWIPERIEMDMPLSEGDRVRLSIESPREGYLYVVDRGLYADGKPGNAMLIFPTRTMRVGENLVRPGKLIDLPGQEDNPNYFTARPLRSAQGVDQVGKVLTIIVTNTPLDLETGMQPLLISAADMTKWEKAWGSETERFEMIGGAGQSWTKEEKEASSATGSRPLTRDDPPPQTLYRIASTNKTAFLVNVRLSYAR
jgi:hypothetical protein